MSQELYPPSASGGGLTDAELRATPVPVADGGSTISIDDGGGSITVDGTVSIGSDTHDAVAGTGVLLTGAYASASAPAAVSADGDAVRLWASRTGVLQVGDGGAALSVDDGGVSLTVDGTVNVGTDQHDELAEVRVTLLGGYASASAPTAVSGDGDAVRLWASRTGVLQVGDAGTTLSIDDGAGSITVDGTVAVSGTVAVTDGGSSLTVDDGGSSLTVDGTLDVRGPATSNSTAGSNYYFPVVGYGSSATPTAIGGDGRYVPLWADTVGRLHTVVDSIGGTVTVDSELPAAAALADATSNPTVPGVGAFPHLWNGSTWDRQVATLTGTAMTVTGQTTTQNSSDIITYGCRGVILFLNVTAYSGGTGLYLSWQVKDPATGNYVTINDSSAQITSTGIYGNVFYPGANTKYTGAVSSGTVVLYAGNPIGRTGRVQVQHVGGTNATYTVGYCLVN